MKKPIRLKSGGFMSSGTDAGDLAILRTAKNIDDGSGMKAGGRVKAKIKKVSSISPVPGGVGPMTIHCLLSNTFLLTKK